MSKWETVTGKHAKPKGKTKKQLDATQLRTHKERVAMRAILRKSGRIPPDADNVTADDWLRKHGYLYGTTWKGNAYKPPKNRVANLARNLGVKP